MVPMPRFLSSLSCRTASVSSTLHHSSLPLRQLFQQPVRAQVALQRVADDLVVDLAELLIMFKMCLISCKRGWVHAQQPEYGRAHCRRNRRAAPTAACVTAGSALR